VTDAGSNVTDFKVGLDGDVTPRDGTFSSLSVYDRDPAGVIVRTSNSTGSTGFNPLDPNTVSDGGAVGTTGYHAANVPEQYVRGDGFMVAGVQINGVRAFDPNLGAWTTPDAYEGEVHDPVSQQRYFWNRGNAVDYSDPSGYCFWDLCIAEGIGIFEVVVAVGATVTAGAASAKVLNDAQRNYVTYKANQQANKPTTLQPGPHAGPAPGVQGEKGKRPTSKQQEGVNAEGEANGCHTCGATTPGTKSGNWIGDHQPASAINPGPNARLLPHCRACSARQGSEVRDAKGRKP
jgi:hypothetical protein